MPCAASSKAQTTALWSAPPPAVSSGPSAGELQSGPTELQSGHAAQRKQRVQCDGLGGDRLGADEGAMGCTDGMAGGAGGGDGIGMRPIQAAMEAFHGGGAPAPYGVEEVPTEAMGREPRRKGRPHDHGHGRDQLGGAREE